MNQQGITISPLMITVGLGLMTFAGTIIGAFIQGWISNKAAKKALKPYTGYNPPPECDRPPPPNKPPEKMQRCPDHGELQRKDICDLNVKRIEQSMKNFCDTFKDTLKDIKDSMRMMNKKLDRHVDESHNYIEVED